MHIASFSKHYMYVTLIKNTNIKQILFSNIYTTIVTAQMKLGTDQNLTSSSIFASEVYRLKAYAPMGKS